MDYKFRGDDVAKDIVDKHGVGEEVAYLYAHHDHRLVHRWHHHIGIYDRYFARYLGTKARLLEIGVSKGGRLIFGAGILDKTL